MPHVPSQTLWQHANPLSSQTDSWSFRPFMTCITSAEVWWLVQKDRWCFLYTGIHHVRAAQCDGFVVVLVLSTSTEMKCRRKGNKRYQWFQNLHQSRVVQNHPTCQLIATKFNHNTTHRCCDGRQEAKWSEENWPWALSVWNDGTCSYRTHRKSLHQMNLVLKKDAVYPWPHWSCATCSVAQPCMGAHEGQQ